MNVSGFRSTLDAVQRSEATGAWDAASGDVNCPLQNHYLRDKGEVAAVRSREVWVVRGSCWWACASQAPTRVKTFKRAAKAFDEEVRSCAS